MTVPFRRICFMVMPYGVRDTGLPPPAPPRVNFDALWEQALKPAIENAGYRAVRADQDQGALIIKEMLERLYYSDLVVADISIANANAYYEIGVRHAARSNGCVLIAADWSRPVFDLAQVRHLRYPNPRLKVSEADARRIREILGRQLPEFRDAPSPVGECIPPKRREGDDRRATAQRAHELAGYLEDFEQLHAQVAAARGMADAARDATVAKLLAQHPAQATTSALVAYEIVHLLRDIVGDWRQVAAYIAALSDDVRRLPYLQEQAALARSKLGSHEEAITTFHWLIGHFGNTAERQGLLGGRYKRIYYAACVPDTGHGGRPADLNNAIEHYENGMQLDLNGYFCSGNLPALYRDRGDDGDEALALETAGAARLACERARKLGIGLGIDDRDDWTVHTLLGLAFAERRIDAAREFARLVAKERYVWKLQTTLETLRTHLRQMSEGQEPFRVIVERLAARTRRDDAGT